MASLMQLQKEVERARRYLYRLESKLHRAQYKTDKERLQLVLSAFKRKYPNEILGLNVPAIAGILPHASRTHDKRILREALAEKYG